jgi:UDP-glucose 4-epimerase
MILLTGATGYIGSHTWLALHVAGLPVVGLDNFSNSSPEVLPRLRALGADASSFVQADVCDRVALETVFSRWPVEAVVHFAAFKSVAESVAMPLQYYTNNVGGLLTLTEVMSAHGCKTLVFSSSATVYGRPQKLPISEDAPLAATNPYGSTKLICEGVLRDCGIADKGWKVALLRYFNPVGAHSSGRLGEDPRGTPNNLMPYIAQVAIGKLAKLRIFGADYDTIDGTGVRDYLHVADLADGHVAALAYLRKGGGSITANLGTGRGASVLEVVRAYERASGRSVPFEIAPRRPGDVDACYADPSLAYALLGWKAHRDLDAMCADSWRWQLANPSGYSAP